jgi:hypothetical protein
MQLYNGIHHKLIPTPPAFSFEHEVKIPHHQPPSQYSSEIVLLKPTVIPPTTIYFLTIVHPPFNFLLPVGIQPLLSSIIISGMTIHHPPQSSQNTNQPYNPYETF